ncbi:predicted protein [Thalassiosira pseudonana CCMP1335]|jgi:hypothetical protein|uniref:BSD domain-containing protein n=1 Tax=Thalassiosira pseudonana TaxID=35128 RepID=B8C668_THAPS|nr:predicted protein [Thalassiosira pseudonana CCMP1335]EED91628.1 predicted protein [Thalassiosira pseudonana CCMP1335]|eukprot:scaffold529_cov196-Alexandrium_tamarense.AAC.9
MGNSTSTPELPSEWLEILPSITKEEIIISSIKRCRISKDKKVYLDDELFELDEHVSMAVEILKADSGSHLKDIRFKLVPGRMPEERFWAAVFAILNDGGVDIEGVIGEVNSIDDDYETGDEFDDKIDGILHTPKTPSPNDGTVHVQMDNHEIKSNADSTNTLPFYLEEINAQQAHIHSLQKSLREANHKIRKLGLEVHKERKKRHDEGMNVKEGQNIKHSGNPTTCPRCNSKLDVRSSQQHSGTWEMHPDCKEFMKLDDHLKENLRKEKEKRLNEVLSQMKFILETDELKDSYGTWSCCGKEEYEAEGCTK